MADENTFPALGERVEAALKSKNYDVTSVVLEGHHIHTDEHECMQVFIRAPLGPWDIHRSWFGNHHRYHAFCQLTACFLYRDANSPLQLMVLRLLGPRLFWLVSRPPFCVRPLWLCLLIWTRGNDRL